jgi:L-gulonolactone oxidase
VVYRRRNPAVVGGGWSTSDLPASVFATGAVQQLLSALTVTDGSGATRQYAKGRDGRWSTPPGGEVLDIVPVDSAVGNAHATFEYLPVAGAIGLLGVVVEAVCQLEPAFNLKKLVRYVDRRDAEARLPQLLEEHDHVSFYYPGGVRDPKVVRLNTWDRTEEPVGMTAKFTKTVREELDLAGAAFFPQLLARVGASDPDAPEVMLLNKERPVVLPAAAAFARQLFYEHDEIEYGVPMAAHAECLEQVMLLLADEEFASVVEVRFTPDTSEALIGPGTAGRGRGGTCFIELASADGEATELRVATVYQKFHDILRAHGGRAHLGKKVPADCAGMLEAYGAAWQGLLALRRELDPRNVFLPAGNPFLRKLVGS